MNHDSRILILILNTIWQASKEAITGGIQSFFGRSSNPLELESSSGVSSSTPSSVGSQTALGLHCLSLRLPLTPLARMYPCLQPLREPHFAWRNRMGRHCRPLRVIPRDWLVGLGFQKLSHTSRKNSHLLHCSQCSNAESKA